MITTPATIFLGALPGTPSLTEERRSDPVHWGNAPMHAVQIDRNYIDVSRLPVYYPTLLEQQAISRALLSSARVVRGVVRPR